MSDLTYKTRGNSSPQGKPRVYFCCHKDDFKKYFNIVSDEILKIADCSIWYSKEREVASLDIDFLKESVNLIVLAITKNFFKNNDSILEMEKEFIKNDILINKDIQLLPIVLETGLDSVFNEYFNSIHYLDRCSSDSTALSYREKLSNFLRFSLVDNEEINSIKNEFDAYAFLSYRKKDRSQAKKLMEIFHQCENCRDVAIWYDEFLKQGEDFNNEITEAIEKSDLFLMNVTPNLLEPDNYVIEHEYPTAINMNKPILLAQMQKTNLEKLKEERRVDINSIIDPEEKDVFFSVLSNYFPKELDAAGKIINNNQSAHLYYMGLAYFYGIDVEKNTNKGLKLITDAADNGYTDALMKLSDIYLNGIDGLCDVNKSAYYIEKACDILLDEYKVHLEIKHAEKYIDSLKKFCNQKLWLKEHYCAIDICEKIVGFIDEYKLFDSFKKEYTDILLFIVKIYIERMNSNSNNTLGFGTYTEEIDTINYFNLTNKAIDNLTAISEDTSRNENYIKYLRCYFMYKQNEVDINYSLLESECINLLENLKLLGAFEDRQLRIKVMILYVLLILEKAKFTTNGLSFFDINDSASVRYADEKKILSDDALIDVQNIYSKIFTEFEMLSPTDVDENEYYALKKDITKLTIHMDEYDISYDYMSLYLNKSLVFARENAEKDDGIDDYYAIAAILKILYKASFLKGKNNSVETLKFLFEGFEISKKIYESYKSFRVFDDSLKEYLGLYNSFLYYILEYAIISIEDIKCIFGDTDYKNLIDLFLKNNSEE